MRKKIIMLPSEKPSQIIMTGGKLFIYSAERPKSSIVDNSPQHLYILSDEEIKEGDWYYSSLDCISKATSNMLPIFGGKKIIATTDTAMCEPKVKAKSITYRQYPQIPQHIIEAYVKKPFDEVEVEYDERFIQNSLKDYKRVLDEVIEVVPKLNPDGTLAVSLVEEKMYSEDILEAKCIAFADLCIYKRIPRESVRSEFDKWIKENL